MEPGAAQAAAAPAVDALRHGDFPAAETAARDALAANGGNSVAAAVHALATYQRAGERARDALTAVIDGADKEHGRLDHAAGRKAFADFASALATVDADLAVAERDPAFALELCLACWDHDWNHTGELDDADRHLFEVEVDATGAELPDGDPRRRPTFRFDAGDIAWARAMIAFQRATVDLVLAYKWDAIDRLLDEDHFPPPQIRIELADAGRVRHARELILAGLAFSDRSRELYLAETDDDREWVPNPRQADHAVPLVMDQAMYDTWAAVTRDVRALVDGSEGLDLGELIGPSGQRGGLGFIDVGRLLSDPHDLTIDLASVVAADEQHGLLGLARQVLGSALVDDMPRSPLVARLLRMSRELDRGDDTFERKLRYFLWIN